MATHQRNFQKNDEWYTPIYAVTPILKRLKPNSTVWCPFDTEKSNFVQYLKDNGFKVIHTHIDNGQDFFQQDPPECDYIISNPPYSLKTEVLKRVYSFDKPFALLINEQGIFDNKDRFDIFLKNGVELLVLHPRVDFITENGNVPNKTPFQSVYVCHRILKNQIEFETIQKRGEVCG